MNRTGKAIKGGTVPVAFEAEKLAKPHMNATPSDVSLR
jgi:hypothetical protein